jgi:hypothetical protein
MKNLGIDASQPDATTGAVGWTPWDFAKAKESCISDKPTACVERLQCLQEQFPLDVLVHPGVLTKRHSAMHRELPSVKRA